MRLQKKHPAKPLKKYSTHRPLNERDHSACGVFLKVNIPRRRDAEIHILKTHQIVKDGLKALSDFNYRSGQNDVTGENDGAGAKFFGLATSFFQQKIKEGQFISPEGVNLNQTEQKLEDHQYAIGQYFLPTDPTKLDEAKTFIQQSVQKEGLRVLGWRNIANDVNLDVLSEKAREKMPALWQAIIVPAQPLGEDANLENIARKSAVRLLHRLQKRKLSVDVVSHSSESITYKGMIPATRLGDFYKDLQNKKFTAAAAMGHSRFATNTNPQWRNAQPCKVLISHNGEFNTAPANAAEMRSEQAASRNEDILPDSSLSDSMQCDADLANQMAKNISLEETLTRLLPPRITPANSDEINAMLRYFRLERSPYNGPAFIVAAAEGHYIAKLDESGLRPSRWALIEDKEGNQQLIMASDDYVSKKSDNVKILQQGELEPGGMIMVTPEGEILRTREILERIQKPYGENYFQNQLEKMVFRLNTDGSAQSHQNPVDPTTLRNILYSAGWDYETEHQGIYYMAQHGIERVGAMGNDANPLHTEVPPHLSYFFHQLFAQVSAPPLDSKNERDRFSLTTFLGPIPHAQSTAKLIELSSPILGVHELEALKLNPHVKTVVLDITVPMPSLPMSAKEAALWMKKAISNLLKRAEKEARKGGILILSNEKLGSDRATIPDLIAVAAVRKHLEAKNLMRQVSIVMDSYQITGPHQASALLAMGAGAVYARGAYQKIQEHYGTDSKKYENFQHAMDKSLLKTMGKMGITDVNNYINGKFIAALGLNLTPDDNDKDLENNPSLANIFGGIYSPLKGMKLEEIAKQVLERHHQSNHLDPRSSSLPHSGQYMPVKDGIKHGYGPEVISAFTQWMKEEDLRSKLLRLHTILEEKGHPNFISNFEKILDGFIDPRKKINGFYPPEYLEKVNTSSYFKKLETLLNAYKEKHPTSIRDHFRVTQPKNVIPVNPDSLQSKESIRALLFSGSMSQGALTVADPKNPEKLGAHETLTQGMNAVGAVSASGEGGEAPQDLRNPLASTKSKQIASGRFGVSALQILFAEEMEIKVAQGAKPGEGGQLSGFKVSIRFAAQRGGIPGVDFISPPPHHDIYSIEDLEQLIYDIKSVNPKSKVAVKLVASEGIGTIAVGVAKAGADVINIASNSGGTGASAQSSIMHAGLPSEIGLAEVNKALINANLRELVQLRVSGGLKTAEDIIAMAILGADLFEFGTTAMLTLGCKMQRTCNHSCQPGVTTDGELFNGDQLHTERYFAHLAAAVQQRLKELGFENLQALKGRTDLLKLIDPKIAKLYDFSLLLDNSKLPPPPSKEQLDRALQIKQEKLARPKDDICIKQIQEAFKKNPSAIVELGPIELTTQDRSFGARITGEFVRHLEQYPDARIIINTTGNAGQSFGCFLAPGISLKHTGPVQDGCGKSMTGGELILCTSDLGEHFKADKNTIAGNAMLYGASGGKIFANGHAGHRFDILLKGAQVVVEGAGDFAFEYMTSGTGMILGKAGDGLCTGAMAGIVFVYDEDNTQQFSDDVRAANTKEENAYQEAIQTMLREHAEKTGSKKASAILENFDSSKFKILIPKAMDKINSLEGIIDIIQTYHLRQTPVTVGMQVWLEQKTLTLAAKASLKELDRLHETMKAANFSVFSSDFCKHLPKPSKPSSNIQDVEEAIPPPRKKVKILNATETRLENVTGVQDHVFLDALQHITTYVSQLKKDAQGCSGCQAQSCAGGENVDTGCPSGKPVNTINATLQRMGNISETGHLTKHQWTLLRQAFEHQTHESPFIAYTGAACPAPCQGACTETIPHFGPAVAKRGNKHQGEPVPIRDIEYYLYQVGRALGWFNGEKLSAENEEKIFGTGTQGTINKAAYKAAMQGFLPPFSRPQSIESDQELIIIGSGPAGMQMAYEALRKGFKVRMYEKSGKPGGLLVDGIPEHKFDKGYLKEDFKNLQTMGLELHLESEVYYDTNTQTYKIRGTETVVAHKDNPNQHMALCLGTGAAKTLSKEITRDHPQIIQAIDFLKLLNEVANKLRELPPTTSTEDRNALITKHLGAMDPRGKKIVVVGGGDTAQDVIRWIARYFGNEEDRGQLNILSRGPEVASHTNYPELPSHVTAEGMLCKEEVIYVNGDQQYLMEISDIQITPEGKLNLNIQENIYKYHNLIQGDSVLSELFSKIPRSHRPLEKSKTISCNNVDLVICAMGFEKGNHIPLVKETQGFPRVYVAGDTADAGILKNAGIIVSAQESAARTFKNKIEPEMKKQEQFNSINTVSSLLTRKRKQADTDPMPEEKDELLKMATEKMTTKKRSREVAPQSPAEIIEPGIKRTRRQTQFFGYEINSAEERLDKKRKHSESSDSTENNTSDTKKTKSDSQAIQDMTVEPSAEKARYSLRIRPGRI